MVCSATMRKEMSCPVYSSVLELREYGLQPDRSQMNKYFSDYSSLYVWKLSEYLVHLAAKLPFLLSIISVL